MSTRYSHPPEDGHDGVELYEHLDDVAARVRLIVPETAETPSGESLQRVIGSVAYVHDFGKATTYFQQHLDLESGSPDFEQYRYHAPIGAFAAYHVLGAQGFATETCLAGFVAVAKHHGSLPDVAQYVCKRSHRRKGVPPEDRNPAEKQQDAIGFQIDDIDANVRNLAERVFHEASDGACSWSTFRDGFVDTMREIEDAVATSGRAPGVDRDALSDSCYGLVLDCWSSLVLADKTSAAVGTSEGDLSSETYDGTAPSIDRLGEYVAKLEASADADPDGTRNQRLNHYRSRAREAVLESTTSFPDDGGVATLTLPTGMGKTLSGLSAAFALRDRIDGDRVIYALPFTSIIDQVVDEMSDIYDADVTGDLLTAHHHLAETTMRGAKNTGVDVDGSADDADRNDDVAGMLAEGWRAGLTVTTFVQLFESLAGPANRQSMKLPALRNSVIVLDEPQSLPLDWWKLVPRLVTMLTERYNATVIAMTATQPQLFEHAPGFDDVPELVDDPDEYFSATERVRYTLDDSIERYIADQEGPKSLEQAATALESVFEAEESALAVCNTIDSAKALTEYVLESDRSITDVGNVYANVLETEGSVGAIDPETVANRAVADAECAVLHLSTRLRPADRLRLIETAKRLTEEGAPFVTVSTQLIEAGVDISFDSVYRDLAPIDSIVQAAGRCNRSFERDRGRVIVWWLDGPEGLQKTPAEAVYNRNGALLPVAAEILESVHTDDTLDETTVARTAVREYYERLHREKDVGSRKYVDFVDEAKADELAKLSLIDQCQSAELVVARTDEERHLLEEIRAAEKAYEYERLGQLLDETKPLRISVPVYRHDSETADALQQLPVLLEDRGLYGFDARRYGSHFDETTGFVVPEGGVDHKFL